MIIFEMQIGVKFAFGLPENYHRENYNLARGPLPLSAPPPFEAIRRDSRFLCADLLAQPCDDKCSKQRKSVKLPKYYSTVSPAPVLEFTTSMFKRPHLSKVPAPDCGV